MKSSKSTYIVAEAGINHNSDVKIAKKMIEAHKGKIWAESKGENKGIKFIFTLPI